MAGPAEANFHWTGSSLIFIFIAYDSAPLQFVQRFNVLVACDESLCRSLVYETSLLTNSINTE